MIDDVALAVADTALARRRVPGRARRYARALVLQLGNVALVLLLVSASTFLLLRAAGGDAAVRAAGDPNMTLEQAAEIRHRLGLDRPLVVQYLTWAGNALQGDLGSSYATNAPVFDLIRSRAGTTLSLTLATMVLSLLFTLVFGLIAGSREGRVADRAITAVSSAALAIPTFWIAILLAFFLAVQRQTFPATGYVSIMDNPYEWAHHLTLPALALAIPLSAQMTLQLRGSLSNVLAQDYVRSAEARGLSWPRVLGKHALKNAAIPTVTLLGVRVTQLIGGTIIVESIFALPGVGTLAIDAVFARDLPMLQGIVVVTASFGILVTLLVEATYRRLDPRIRAS